MSIVSPINERNPSCPIAARACSDLSRARRKNKCDRFQHEAVGQPALPSLCVQLRSNTELHPSIIGRVFILRFGCLVCFYGEKDERRWRITHECSTLTHLWDKSLIGAARRRAHVRFYRIYGRLGRNGGKRAPYVGQADPRSLSFNRAVTDK